MSTTIEMEWLDASGRIAASQLCSVCLISREELDELLGYGALRPLEQDVFSASWVAPLRHALKLRRAYDLDLFTVSLLVEHMRRIEDLEQELAAMRAHLRGGG